MPWGSHVQVGVRGRAATLQAKRELKHCSSPPLLTWDPGAYPRGGVELFRHTAP